MKTTKRNLKSQRYSDQVFINCPFDDQYKGLFYSLVFTVIDCGFVPRCSQEIDDATVNRLNKIIELIGECKYGIHDLSRVKLDVKTNLPRFNMPYELGLFHAAKAFGEGEHKKKNCVILEKGRYRFRKFISDISGIDVADHNETQKKCVKKVRDWLLTASRRNTIPDSMKIYSRHRKFMRDLKKACKRENRDYKTMPFIELTYEMSEWLRVNQGDYRSLFKN